MKNYLLDTDTCIYFINGKYDLRRKLKTIGKKRQLIKQTLAKLVSKIRRAICSIV